MLSCALVNNVDGSQPLWPWTAWGATLERCRARAPGMPYTSPREYETTEKWPIIKPGTGIFAKLIVKKWHFAVNFNFHFPYYE